MKDRCEVVLVAFYDVDSFPVRTLHAVLDEAGFDVRSIFFKQLNPNNTMDPPAAEEIEHTVNVIAELRPYLIGMSLRSAHLKLAGRLTTALKARLDTPVLWGGTHPSIKPQQCLEFADMVCLGEGEDALVELAGALRDGRPIETIQNLWIKAPSGVIRNDQRRLIKDLDRVPFADFSQRNKRLLDGGREVDFPSDDERVSYWMMTSRGCPYSCTFCGNSFFWDAVKGKGSWIRRRGVDDVIEELVEARRRFRNLLFINFEDDVFTFNVRWLTEFRDKYRRHVNLPFFCYCHPKATSEETIRLVREAGCVSMTMGVQAGSERIRRDLFLRNETDDELIEAAGILHRHGIHCSYDIIMDNPLEEESDRRATLELLLKFPRPFELHTHTLTHFPGTKLTDILLERGIIRLEDCEDMKEQSYERWTPALDLRRDRDNLFWDNLYYLAAKGYAPDGLIRRLSRSRLLKAYPHLLTLLLRFFSADIQTVRRGSRFDLFRRNVMLKLRERLEALRNRGRAWRRVPRKDQVCV